MEPPVTPAAPWELIPLAPLGNITHRPIPNTDIHIYIQPKWKKNLKKRKVHWHVTVYTLIVCKGYRLWCHTHTHLWEHCHKADSTSITPERSPHPRSEHISIPTCQCLLLQSSALKITVAMVWPFHSASSFWDTPPSWAVLLLQFSLASKSQLWGGYPVWPPTHLLIEIRAVSMLLPLQTKQWVAFGSQGKTHTCVFLLSWLKNPGLGIVNGVKYLFNVFF